MHVLRKTHEALVPGGRVLDIHPIPPQANVEAGGKVLGHLRTRQEAERFFGIVRNAEARLDELVSAGLFVHERELRRVIVERYESPEELFDQRDEAKLLARTRNRLRTISGHVDVVETFVFRLLRAV